MSAASARAAAAATAATPPACLPCPRLRAPHPDLLATTSCRLQQKRQEWAQKGHGEYREVEEKEFFKVHSSRLRTDGRPCMRAAGSTHNQAAPPCTSVSQGPL